MEKVNILIADDHEVIHNGIRDILRSHKNYTIVGNAYDGEEAIEKALELKPDIIFMDIMMPEKDGLEATAEIRSAGYKLPIVAMTANAREEDKTKAFNSGMNHYLAKPVRTEQIKEVLIRYFSEQPNNIK